MEQLSPPIFSVLVEETDFDVHLLDERKPFDFKEALAAADRELFKKQQPGNGKRQRKRS